MAICHQKNDRKKVNETDLQQIFEAIRLSPSSRGLQPYKIFVIESNELKAKIQPIADSQAQIIECSHLLVFAVETSTSKEDIENYIQNLATQRNIPIEKLDGLKSVLLRDQLLMNEEQYYHWATKQAYIALAYGQLMANTLGIDAAAMEGFNPKQLDELLGLEKIGLKSSVLLALGYRDEETDYMLKLKKVRKSKTELFQSIE
jgi:nitroreductase / dihydropteridine reductase